MSLREVVPQHALIPEANLRTLPRGSHVSWIVNDDASYVPIATSLAQQGRAANEKVLAFAPSGSPVLDALGPHASVATDPLAAFLDGVFDVDVWLGHFGEQHAFARAEGFRGLCIVADMDWILAAAPTMEDTIRFELLLDRLGPELGATIVCAYRSSSFGEESLKGVHAVHRHVTGGETPQFRMIDGPDAWFLYGEVDMAVERQFDAALKTVCGDERLLIDVAGLAFIDVRGIRALARAMSMVPLQLIGVRPFLRRLWKVGGFDEIAPLAEAANGSNPDLTLR